MDRMKPHQPRNTDEEALLYLLSLAAAYRPSREAPAHLVRAALRGRGQPRREAKLGRGPALAIIIALPILVSLALATRAWWLSYRETAGTSGPNVAAAPATAHTLAHTALATEPTRPLTTSARPRQSSSLSRSPARTVRPVAKNGRSGNAVPRVRMKYETVRRYYAGLLAPAVLAQTDASTGQEITTPVIVDVPVEINGEREVPSPWLHVQPAGFQP